MTDNNIDQIIGLSGKRRIGDLNNRSCTGSNRTNGPYRLVQQRP